MNTLCLPARLDAHTAGKAFMCPRWGNLFGLLARAVHTKREPGKPAPLPFVERIWMPAYAIRFAFSSRRGPSNAWVSVDGCSGAFALFEPVEELAEREIREDLFPSLLDEAAAEQAGRQGLLKYALRIRGGPDKPVVDAMVEIRSYHFAVWVYYYRRRLKYIDLKVLDGYTGKSAGAKMRVSVINALIAARQQRDPAGK